LEHDHQAVHIPSAADTEILEARNQQEAPSVEDKVADILVELDKVDLLEMELDKAEE
jgi:hypothetical protein